MSHAASEQTITLPRTEGASSIARAFLREACCTDHHSAVLDDAQLLVSELVTNAVRHGGPPIMLLVRCDESRAMQIGVTDGSPETPEPHDASPLDEGGRGLMLVDILSEDWGVQPMTDGKLVWFLMRADPAEGAADELSASPHA